MADREREVTIKIAAKNLTAAEFKKAREGLLGLDHAAGKSRKGIEGLGTSFSSVGKSLGQISPRLSSFAAGLSQMLGPTGVIASIAASIVAFKKLLDISVEFQQLGAQMVDMASKTSLSTDALQELGFAGKQVGLNVDVVAEAVLRLGRRSAAELPETVTWLNRIGLSVDDITSKKPEEAFRLVADAIGSMSNPMEQSAAAMGIFGDQGLRILPLIRSDVDATIGEFKRLGLTIDQDVLAAGKRLDDQMTSLTAVWTSIKSELAGETIPVLSELAETFLLLRETQQEWEELKSADPPFWVKLGGSIVSGLFPSTMAVKNFREELSIFNEVLGGLDKSLRTLPKAPGGLVPHIPDLLPKGAPNLDEILKEWEREKAREGSILDQELKKLKDKKEKPKAPKELKKPWYEEEPWDDDHIPFFFTGKTTGAVFDRWKDSLVAITPKMGDARAQTAGLTEETARFAEVLQEAAYLTTVFGSTLSSMLGGAASAIGGFSSLFKGEGGGFGLGALTEQFKSAAGKLSFGSILSGLSKTLPAIGALVGPLISGIKKLFSLGGPDIGRDVGRDLGVNISEELERTIRESGQPIQLAIADIFREGFANGTATADDLAREIGDLFSGFERGEYGKPQLIQALEESVPILIQRLRELGPAGEEQLNRIIAAAERFGVTFEGLSELVQGTFAPETMESIAEQFGITNDEVRALADELGIDIQTNLERMAASVGLTTEEFKALGKAVEEKYGIPMEDIDELLAAMGVSAEDLAKALGVETGDELGDNLEDSKENLKLGGEYAEYMAEQLERAARAAGGISIPGYPGMDEHFAKETPPGGRLFTRPTRIVVGEVPEVVDVRHASRAQSQGGASDQNFYFYGPVYDADKLALIVTERIKNNNVASANVREGIDRLG